MNERRRIRRSSPDAPQGIVPVLTVFAGLVAVAVLGGLGLSGSPGSSSAEPRTDSVAARGKDGKAGDTTVVPTTDLIKGAVTTTLFVTTTTPITTTTSTTTTTLAGPALDPSGPEIVFGPGQLSVAFTVRSADPDGLDFDVTEVPAGMTSSPTHATVSAADPVRITLRITDPARARGGTLVLVGDDGSRVPVRVKVQTAALAVAAVAFEPDPPECGSPVRLIALVTGSRVRSVTVTVSTDGGSTTLPMSRIADGAWAVKLSSGPTSSTLSGTVTATDTEGTTDTRAFSTKVAGSPGCPH